MKTSNGFEPSLLVTHRLPGRRFTDLRLLQQAQARLKLVQPVLEAAKEYGRARRAFLSATLAGDSLRAARLHAVNTAYAEFLRVLENSGVWDEGFVLIEDSESIGPVMYSTSEEARVANVVGWKVRCGRCGSYGAARRPPSDLLLCASCDAGLSNLKLAHEKELLDYTHVRFPTVYSPPEASQMPDWYARYVKDVGSEGCWLWIGCTAHGQPRVRHEGRMVQAVRIVYEISRGVSVVDPQRVYRTCQNTLCLRPTHLTLGTQTDINRLRLGSKNGSN